MKKSLSTILLGSLVLASSLNANYLKDSELKSFNELELVKKVGGTIVSVYDAKTLYVATIKVQNTTDKIFLTKDKKYLIAGNVIDTKTGDTLTAPIKNIDIAKGKESFVFGSGTKEYYLFTDPECPYCKKLEEYLPQLEKEVKLNIFYYPLLSLHPTAKELAKFQLSLKNKNKNILEILSKTTSSADFINRKYDEKETAELDAKIDEQMKIAESFGVTGTPTFITSDGKTMNWVSFLESHNIKTDLSK